MAGQSVVFDLASAYTVTFETDTASKRLVVRNDDVTFDLAGFFYNLSESTQPSVVVGELSGNIGKLTITHGHLEGTSGTIGAAEGSIGQVTVGSEGTWTNTQGLTVGGGAGLLNVQFGGSVAVGTTLDVTAGGTVNLEAGTITASTMNVAGGTVTVTSGVLGLSAGLLSVSGGGTLNLDGGTLNATLVNITGGSLHLSGGVLTLADGLLRVSNAGSLTGEFSVDGGTTLGVTDNGSIWTNTGDLRVGDVGQGTLTVSGGGEVSADTLRAGIGSTSRATITVSGLGTSLTASGPLTVGQQGTASLTVNAGGSLVSTDVKIGSEAGGSGSITLDGAGSILAASGGLFVGGSDSASGGTGSLTATAGATVHVEGPLKIWSGGSVMATSGTLTFDLDQLQMAGGTLAVPTINLTGHNLAGFGIVRANISGTGTITATGGDLTIGNPDSYAGFTFTGEIEFGSNTLTLQSKGFIELGHLTTIAGGTLAAPHGVFLPGSHNVAGFGALDGRVAAAVGSTIEATGNLSLGSSSSFDGFLSYGALVVNNHTVTIHDRDVAVLGSLTTLGNSDGPGTLAAANGFLLPNGMSLVGYGTVTGHFDNNGRVQGEGPEPGDKLEFSDLVTGRGDFGGTVLFNGGYSPGNSPAEVRAENLILGSGNVLTLELGGLTAGNDYDLVNVSGNLTLDGMLDVHLINGYVPALGDTFTVLTFGSRNGDLSGYLGLDVGGGLALSPLWDTTSLVFRAMPALDGDINLDGLVNIFDINAVSAHWGEAGPEGDANGDGLVNIFDINLISANWTAGQSSVATVPEPSGVLLAANAIVGLIYCVRNRQRAIPASIRHS